MNYPVVEKEGEGKGCVGGHTLSKKEEMCQVERATGGGNST